MAIPKLAMIPSGYKDGKVYSVLPTNGDGDFTFSRGSNATRVNKDGLIETMPLELGSELIVNGDFSNGLTDWTENGGSYATIVSGALNSNNTNSGSWHSENISQDVSFVNNKVYLASFKARNVSGNSNLRITQGANVIFTTNLTSSFVDYEVFYTANADNGSIRIFCNDSVGQFEIDNVSVKEVISGLDLPRLDYTDSSCPSLLLEPQSTNLVEYSEDFSEWNKTSGATTTSDYGVSPSGLQDSTRVQFSTSNEQIYIGSGTHSGNTEVASLYIKGVSGESIQFGVGTNTAQGTTITLNGNWQRITQESTSGSVLIIGNYSATATDFEIWGAQLEEQSYATSYIPTNGSVQTRLADECNGAGNASTFNDSEGVLYAEISALADDTTDRSVSISDGTTSNTIRIEYLTVSNAIWAVVTNTSTGGNQAILQYTSPDITINNKVAIKYKENDFSLYVNGIEVATDTSGVTFSTNTLNTLSFNRGNVDRDFYGKVKDVRYYNTALTDAELEALTQ